MTTSIIQARMSSTRLPGKVMKPLSGKPMLWHVIQRVSRAKKAGTIVVATSTQRDDDPIARACRLSDTRCYRGPLDNVLERCYGAAKVYGADTVVRITADCPLIDPDAIDRCISRFEESGADYVSNVYPTRTAPKGLDVEVFSFRALETAFCEAQDAYEKEHVTPYIWENKKGGFRISPPGVADSAVDSKIRLVVDYPKDYELLTLLYDRFYRADAIINLSRVAAFLKRHPDIAAINASCT